MKPGGFTGHFLWEESVMQRSRRKYLQSLAEEYGVSARTVLLMADLLGEEEDYDGLPAMLEELAEAMEEMEE